MIDKAMVIIIFMYAISFSILGVQYEIADVYHKDIVTLVDVKDSSGAVTIPAGTPIRSSLIGYVNQNELNTRASNMLTANYTGNTTFYSKIETFTTGAAYVAWELVTLLSGTYIFNLMYLLGVPLYFVIGFLALYIFLLSRAILGYVRGI